MSRAREDGPLTAAFLEMMAAEAGAARNTLLAYERDLRGASELLDGRLSSATPDELKRLAEAWLPLKRATVARKAAALRRFFGFLQDEGLRSDDPSAALPRPAGGRALPRVLDHHAVDALFAELDRRRAEDPGPGALRLTALIELLYGSGLRATELVSLPRHALSQDRPFLILRGKGGRERLVPISDRARAAVAAWSEEVPRDTLWLFPSGAKHLSRVRLYQLVRESRSRNLHPAYSVHILVQVARALERMGVVHAEADGACPAVRASVVGDAVGVASVISLSSSTTKQARRVRRRNQSSSNSAR